MTLCRSFRDNNVRTKLVFDLQKRMYLYCLLPPVKPAIEWICGWKYPDFNAEFQSRALNKNMLLRIQWVVVKFLPKSR